MNALIEMSRLVMRRPGPDTDVEAAAAWHQAKGRLLEQLAADGGPDAADSAAHAAAAYARARSMLRGPLRSQYEPHRQGAATTRPV
ncbi:hypothetical protein [Rhodococcus sp. NPDC127528]|uniref:hypothetical protein n=1 Tax=unclassified Rhodococcus (in: high G+C Gram-positive bacteria) TaxID=192944 RepID=UPI003626359B